jgi:hypothetical protein
VKNVRDLRCIYGRRKVGKRIESWLHSVIPTVFWDLGYSPDYGVQIRGNGLQPSLEAKASLAVVPIGEIGGWASRGLSKKTQGVPIM